jgi:hypothetical protein
MLQSFLKIFSVDRQRSGSVRGHSTSYRAMIVVTTMVEDDHGGDSQASACRGDRMKITSILAALLLVVPISQSIAGCYGRTNARAQTRFVLRGGEAIDTRTGLVWQRCSLGTTWDGKHGCEGDIMFVGLDELIRRPKNSAGIGACPPGRNWRALSIDRVAARW